MKKITNETWDHLKSISLDNGIFHPFKFVTLCQFHCSTSPVLFTREKKIFCKYGCFSVSHCIQGKKSQNSKLNF